MSECRTFYGFDVIVVGTGAAGYNAAIRLAEDGRKKVALIGEGKDMGTSRNTGSDKQTYYKLGLGGSADDSVRKMAHDLFSAGAVDGDNALCEAALSVRSFMHLAEIGVPFPMNRYGEYIGYKTDHDPYARATSAGPLTSKFMTEALEKQAKKLNIPYFDGEYAVEILKREGEVCGILTYNEGMDRYTAFSAPNVILATGGPAGIYEDSVYPTSQTGSTGLALLAGAETQNLTEWQYGLASTCPRWNVSGTYMQVLPRLVSVDEMGVEREFLSDYFRDPYEALSTLFLKGYQWPFDCKKVLNGSSVIDLLVFTETKKNRKVYLDYRKNPFGLADIDFTKLSEEAYTYLNRAEATFGTPIARLLKMNEPAVELYRNKGVDITKEMLPIALSAQHHNGGIAVDKWWETTVHGLFAVGECAGTHGIARPGGSALNAGQVGSLRAALRVAASTREPIAKSEFEILAYNTVFERMAFAESIKKNPPSAEQLLTDARRDMSDAASAVRNPADMEKLIEKKRMTLESFSEKVGSASLLTAYRLRDTLVTQIAVLTAMTDFAKTIHASRGSALYRDENGALREGLSEDYRLSLSNGADKDRIQTVSYKNGVATVVWREVRPIPSDDDFFENVWRSYRENGNIY